MNNPSFPDEHQFSEGCYFPCSGNDVEYCGGRGLIDVYNNPNIPQLPQPSVQPFAGDYYSKGCYVDNTQNVRVLTVDWTSLPEMTPDYCATYCAEQNCRLFGVEFG
jgi:hypothetical protein